MNRNLREPASSIIHKFAIPGTCGAVNLSRLTGIKKTTISQWRKSGFIPTKHHTKIIDAGKEIGIEIKPSDFLDGLY